MTWVLGVSSIFDYAAIVSDIQVTLSDKKTRLDILQKAYPLSDFLLAGFSGSVKIGFKQLQSLSMSLQTAPNEKNIVKIATGWARAAKLNFDTSSDSEKKLGSKFLLVGIGYDETQVTGMAPELSTYLVRFSSPDFKPQFIKGSKKSCSIGSGSKSKEFRRFLLERMNSEISMFETEMVRRGWWARMLVFSLTRALQEYPQDGVSQHLHVFGIGPNGNFAGNNNERVYPQTGEVIEFAMPKVATTYDEFLKLLKEQKRLGAGAVC